MGTLKWPKDLFIFFLHHEVHSSQNGIYGDWELFYVFQTGQNHCWPSYQNLAETIEKPSMSMVNQRKNIKWWWSSGSKTINSNGTLKKNHYHPIVVKKWPLLKSISPPQVNCPPQGRSAVGRALVAWQDPDTSSKLSKSLPWNQIICFIWEFQVFVVGCQIIWLIWEVQAFPPYFYSLLWGTLANESPCSGATMESFKPWKTLHQCNGGHSLNLQQEGINRQLD